MVEQRALRRGDIWYYDPDPAVGREQGRTRPGLIVSTDRFNVSDRDLIALLPLTRTARPYWYHVPITADESGLPATSYIMCEQIRTVSPLRLRGHRPAGQAPSAVLAHVEHRLRVLLGLLED